MCAGVREGWPMYNAPLITLDVWGLQMGQVAESNQTSSQERWLKTAMKIIDIVLVIFIILNVVWFGWRSATYRVFVLDGMEETESSTFIVPRYLLTTDDGYSYSIKYPNYLSTTGNLGLTLPSDYNEALYTDSLIIWPKLDGSYEYGVILYDDDVEWQIMVDASGRALDSQYDEVIEAHAENVALLFEKANEQWDLSDSSGQ